MEVRRQRLVDASYESEVLEPVRRFARCFMLSTEERALLDRRYEDQATLRDLELPMMARHGDFCPANMTTGDGGIGVFDWEFPLRHEMPLFDLFFFFSSLRFPYRGRRGESDHFTGFEAAFWGDNYLNHAMRRRIGEVSERFEIPAGAIPDLFLLSLIQTANMKYESLMTAGAYPRPESDGDWPPEEEMRQRWHRFAEPDKNAPFACIEAGVSKNVALVVTRGLPF